MKGSIVKGIGGIALVALTLGTTFGLQVHKDAYAASTPAMQKSNIIVNGKHFSTQYKFVYNGTTYMPVWYIMQALKKSGAQVSWNGSQWKIGVNGSFTPTVWHGVGGNGEVMIYSTSDPSNVQTVETGINMQVYPDPADGIKTTFFPIYDIQVILRDLRYRTDTWDGTNWSIAMGNGSSSSTGSTSGQGGATNPPLPSGTSQTQYNNAVTQTTQETNNASSPLTNYSALSSSTQWYNDPSDVFYNKQFPVSELKNGTVLQKSPYVIVSTVDGSNSNNMGYVYVLEYVGYGLNATGTPSTYWKETQVYTNTGKMFAVVPNVQSFMVASNSIGGYPDLTKPQNVSGINFGSNDPTNPTWAISGGTNAIPIQGWSPQG